MCVSLGGETDFSGTQIAATIQDHAKHGLINTLAYSVKCKVPGAGSRPGMRRIRRSTGRAIFLPIPAVPGTFGEANLVDTTTFRNFTKDQVDALSPTPKSASFSTDMLGARRSRAPAEVFHIGDLTVVFATDANSIPEVLASNRIPEAKRPQGVSEEFCDFAQRMYGPKDYIYLLGCFDETVASRITFMIWYKSQFPDALFYPAIDEHTGLILPQVGEPVDTDHWLTASVPGMVNGEQVYYKDEEAVKASGLIASHVRGIESKKKLPNGDFLINAADLRSQDAFTLRRISPPGAEKQFDTKVDVESSWGW